MGQKKLKHNRPGDKCMILKQEHNNMGLIMLEKGKKKFLHAVQSHLKSEVFLTVVNGHTITTYIFRQSSLKAFIMLRPKQCATTGPQLQSWDLIIRFIA